MQTPPSKVPSWTQMKDLFGERQRCWPLFHCATSITHTSQLYFCRTFSQATMFIHSNIGSSAYFHSRKCLLLLTCTCQGSCTLQTLLKTTYFFLNMADEQEETTIQFKVHFSRSYWNSSAVILEEIVKYSDHSYSIFLVIFIAPIYKKVISWHLTQIAVRDQTLH